MTEDHPRLPPPPFWRTEYFVRLMAERIDRQCIRSDEILAVLNRPKKVQIQADGRVRSWGRVERTGRWLRVVTLEDGITVHNAFFDRRFKP